MKQRIKRISKNDRIYYRGRLASNNIFKFSHLFERPNDDEVLPLFIEENPSKNYYFPIERSDVERVLEKLQKEDFNELTHVWFKREAVNDGFPWLGRVILTGSVRVIVLHPWPVSGRLLWSRSKKPLQRWRRLFLRYGAQWIQDKHDWYVFLEGDNLKRFYLEQVFLYEMGYVVDSRTEYWKRMSSKHMVNYTQQYALDKAKEL